MIKEIQTLTEDQIESVDGGLATTLAIIGLFAVVYQIGYERGETQVCRV